jgi:hypothetical protein
MEEGGRQIDSFAILRCLRIPRANLGLQTAIKLFAGHCGSQVFGGKNFFDFAESLGFQAFCDSAYPMLKGMQHRSYRRD